MSVLVVVSLVSALVAVLSSVGGLLITLFKRGQAEGRAVEIMSQLTAITQDHETRIRVLETHRAS